MTNQLLMGTPVKLLQQKANWFQIQSPDGYVGWLETQELVRLTAAEQQAWFDGPQIIVTAFHDFLWEQPDPKSLPVSDVVMGVMLKRVSSSGGWIKVELPGGRTGHLQRQSAAEYDSWKRTTRPTPANIERLAKSFLGVPYLWGGSSTKALDCSGFTRLVFQMNGVQLPRDARQQVLVGGEVEPGEKFAGLQKGDLLFFAGKGGRKSEDVTHVAIHLENRMFIHSAGCVHFNSLDPASPLYAEDRLKTFFGARRVL
jgi:cell wall-associated NlpC family hydrolase